MMNADLNLFGASGAFLYLGPDVTDLLGFWALLEFGSFPSELSRGLGLAIARLPCLPFAIVTSFAASGNPKEHGMWNKNTMSHYQKDLEQSQLKSKI
jgi:hypothetical protein